MTGYEPPATGRTWRHPYGPSPATRGGRPARSRRVRGSRLALLIVGGLFAGFCGLLVWVVMWLDRPRPVRVVLLAAGYEQNLAVPHDVYGRRWAEGLAGLAAEGPLAGYLKADPGGPLELRGRSQWDAGLRGAKERTVVVGIAAHGGADANGPYLLPTDAAPGAAAFKGLRLEAILSRLAELPPATKKVLLLDATQVPANPLFGMLENDFAAALDRFAERIEAVPNLVVLSASGPGERSWPIESHGRTAFGHYLLTGLSGAADADGNRRVTAWELQTYLAGRVRSFVAHARAAAQTPQLYPHGPEGERRAKAITLAVRPDRSAPPAEPEPPAFSLPPALKVAWERHRDLDRQEPHPAAYAPHPWRVYEASLLRYEQLLTAGDEKAAAETAKRLAELERDIAARRRVDLRSAGNTLAMPAVAGADVAADPAASRSFDAMWAAPPDQQKKRIDDWLASAGPPAAARHRFYTLLLDRAIADPAGSLARAAALARRAEEPGRPRPAEIQFLLMLAGNLPADALPARAKLVATALRVRSLGERAAVPGGYAEQIHSRIAAKLKSADAARAEAEDLVFATADADLRRAGEQFARAEAEYTQLLADADRVRAALRVRDRLFAALPFYAAWAADHPDPDATTPAAAVLDLWRRAHDLDSRLRSAAPPDQLPDATDLQARFDALAGRLTKEVESLVPLPPPDMPPIAARATIDRVLGVPTLDPDRRMRLLAVADRLARDHLRPPADAAPSTASGEPSPAPARRGQLALAEIGAANFDAVTPRGRPSFADTLTKLSAADQLAAAGAEIGDRLARLPAEIRQLLDRAPVAAADRARADLLAADRLARAAPAGLALPQPDATTALRHHLLQELLIAQAARTAEQAWAGGDPAAEPYFRAAGRAYLDDVEPLEPDDALRRAVSAARERLARPFDVALAAPARVAVTDAAPFAIETMVQAPPRADVFPGYVVLWAEPTGDLSLATPGRVAQAIPGSPKFRAELDSPRMTAASTNPSAVPAGVAVRGYFRGRALRRDAPIDLFPQPDLTVRYTPPPPTAAVAVRASKDVADRFGVGDGTIAVVIDCSGSMAAPQGRPADESRLREATRAAARLLSKLPRGISVSVWAFGQAGDAGRRVDDAEKTVLHVFGPTQWNPDDAGQLSALSGKLNALDPYNQSPLYRAMLQARTDALPGTGYRAVVVFTDGADNRFASDKELNPDAKPGLTVLAEKFRTGGVTAHVVAFPYKTGDEFQAQTGLKAFVENLPVPGKFVPIAEVDELAAHLRQALSPRLICRLTGEGVAVNLDLGTGGGDRWPTERYGPGRYQVSAPGTGAAAPVALRPGDNLLLTLAPTARGPEFRRLPFAADYPWKPSADSDRGDWKLAVLQNRLEKAGGLRMLATLEEADRPAADGAAVVRPAETWIEVGTELETAFPAAVRVSPAWGYPAPAWDIDAPAWPPYSATGTPARPVLRVWWDADRPARSAADVPLAELLQSTAPKAVTVGRDQVTITASLDRQPGRGGPAVVVRVSHPAGRPVIARLDGPAVDGYEHRLFTKAGRYTGVFWPAAAGDAAVRAAVVRLVPLEEFKAGARRIEVRDLRPPDPNDDRPPPVGGTTPGR